MLVDDDTRPLLLGLNWRDDGGAVDLLTAGTARDFDGDGSAGPRQAAAALAVMLELGGDRDVYLDRTTPAMQPAIVDLGIRSDEFRLVPGVRGSAGRPQAHRVRRFAGLGGRG